MFFYTRGNLFFLSLLFSSHSLSKNLASIILFFATFLDRLRYTFAAQQTLIYLNQRLVPLIFYYAIVHDLLSPAALIAPNPSWFLEVKHITMNIKRIFGALLTILGIFGLIYASIIFVNSKGNSSQNVKALVMYGILGVLFFVAGIGLVRTIKDESWTTFS